MTQCLILRKYIRGQSLKENCEGLYILISQKLKFIGFIRYFNRMFTLNISKDSNNWFIKNINWLSVNKNQMGKKNEIHKKEWFKNKKYNTKTNKRISKSN